MNRKNPNFYAIIPAGGIGSRLWPLSRAGAPKFLHDLTGEGLSLLQSTWKRLAKLTDDNIMVVTGVKHERAVREQLFDLKDENLVLESEQKDSAAAIGLATAIVYKRNPEAIVGSFAADHVIKSQSLFDRAMKEALIVAEKGYIVTLGIKPSFPSTGFGYIKQGKPLKQSNAKRAYHVEEFVEKPEIKTAKKYVASGRYRWNAGMFVAKAETMLDAFKRDNPELYKGIMAIADSWDTPKREEVLNKIWPTLPKIAIDYVVAEPEAKAGNVVMIAGNFDWDDVGDFDSLTRLNEKGNDATVLGDPKRVMAKETSGIIVSRSKRMITTYGLEDIVIVDTDDALLVTTRQHSQEVKNIVTSIENHGLDRYL
ncbi:MAG: mannose-1-phosphate guanylyltransferase [Micrococcaceae bacterium]